MILLCDFDQCRCVLDRFGDRFFDQTMNSCFQNIARNFIMQAGGDSETDRIDLGKNIMVVAISLNPMFFGDLLRAPEIVVDYC